MHDPIAHKLNKVADLGADERVALGALPYTAATLGAREDLRGVGDGDVVALREGCAVEFRTTSAGARQVVRLLLSGDTYEPGFASERLRCRVAAVTPCSLVRVDAAALDGMLENVGLARAWTKAKSLDETFLREGLIRLGRHSGYSRIAHFMCETYHRMRSLGLADDKGFPFPLVQQDLGDTLGLSSVHTNRVLKVLVGDGLITYGNRNVGVPDLGRLEEAADFDVSYLRPSPRDDGADPDPSPRP